jgi:hypothetical protein
MSNWRFIITAHRTPNRLQRSQGGVELPTGGDGDDSHEPASARFLPGNGVSRFGVNPKPTVTVRMKESAGDRSPGEWSRRGTGIRAP